MVILERKFPQRKVLQLLISDIFLQKIVSQLEKNESVSTLISLLCSILFKEVQRENLAQIFPCISWCGQGTSAYKAVFCAFPGQFDKSLIVALVLDIRSYVKPAEPFYSEGNGLAHT